MQDPGVCHSLAIFSKVWAWAIGTFVGNGKLKLATRLHRAWSRKQCGSAGAPEAGDSCKDKACSPISRELGVNALVPSRTGLLSMWVAETWNELFQRQESWCREAAQSALRQWWACPGRIIHPNTKKASQRCLSPLPQSTLSPGFFLACMYPCENPSLSSLFCCLTPSGSLQPCCCLPGDDPYSLVDCFGWGWVVHPGKLPSGGWCHNSSCWICKLPLYSTDPLSLSS